MSFIQRKITVTFSRAQGVFTGTSSNVVTISGLRITATVVKSGGVGMGQSQFRIFGLTPSLMQDLSTYGIPANLATASSIQIEAGDDEKGMSIVAVGTITSAWADYNQMPEVCLNVEAFTGYLDAIKPIAPTSIAGRADVATIMASLAKAMGYVFENNNVNVLLTNPYFWGTARTQAEECAKAADIEWIIDNGVLAIWPKGGSRSDGDAEQIMVTPSYTISPESGMVGYPTFTLYGIVVRALFFPHLKFGSTIQVKSSLQPACGTWTVTNIAYELESETPNGSWFMTIQAVQQGYVPSA